MKINFNFLSKPSVRLTAALGGALLLTATVLNNTFTPQDLQARAERLLLSNQYLAKLVPLSATETANQLFEPVVRAASVQTVRANRERVVIYKNKRIRILVPSADQEVPEEFLELLYQAELAKEQREAITPAP